MNKRWRILWCVVMFGIIIFCINAYLLAVDLSTLKSFGNEIGIQIGKIQDLVMGEPQLPTLYEYYVGDGEIHSGLTTPNSTMFKLNGKDIVIFSGAIHYFRVHPLYWRDRLRKLRAAGLNTVETYVPWNLHEPEQGKYDFGQGIDDMSDFLDVVKFIRTAQEEDLLVIVRPGPYICAEWEFGGLPSWLLHNPDLKVRRSDPLYIAHVESYFDKLLPKLAELQFTRGGPVIGFQIENEYGAIASHTTTPDHQYLLTLKLMYEKHGLDESLLFTADMPSAAGLSGSVPGTLMAANFDREAPNELNILKNLQPDKPLIVMEYWTGWFDHWGEQHHIVSVETYLRILDDILSFPSSVNLYMFHGGTTFGFLNGANLVDTPPRYQPDVNSYDYDAPLSESGDYTPKYNATAEIVLKYNPVKTRLPPRPAESIKYKYNDVKFSGMLRYNDLVLEVDVDDKTRLVDPLPMEHLNINNGNGQSYGFIVYRVKVNITKKAVLKIDAHVGDKLIILLNGRRVSPDLYNKNEYLDFGYSDSLKNEFEFPEDHAGLYQILDIFVENRGRVNYAHSLEDFKQLKGISPGHVYINNHLIQNFEVIPLQFKKEWVNSLDKWDKPAVIHDRPTLYRFEMDVKAAHDTFMDMSRWYNGIVFVNGFNIGRYQREGPPSTLYIPYPLLNVGKNEILVFEQYYGQDHITFSNVPLLGTPSQK